MSIRRFNYTQRCRIAQRDVAIYLAERSGEASFDVLFDFSGYDLPADAGIVVEAYRQTTVRRYPFGCVADPGPRSPAELGDFGGTSGILFRAKITDQDGRLLAQADQLHAADPNPANRRSLFRVSDADLDGELWRLSFDPGGPLLELERSIPRESLLESPNFQSMVYPELLRQVLRRALDEGSDEADDASAWQAKVIGFAARLCGSQAPDDERDDDEVREEWINRAVSAFCMRNRFSQKFTDGVIPEDPAA